MYSLVTHVRKNILKRQKKEKPNPETESRVYCQHIQKPQYQLFKVEDDLRVFDNGTFQIFPLLQMHSQNTTLWRSYETRFQQKFKTKLNKL